jgi:hypothetical protein
MRNPLKVLLSVALTLACAAGAQAADPPATRVLEHAVVRAVADDQSSLALRHDETMVSIAAGKEFKKRLEDLRPGDEVTVHVGTEPRPVLHDLAAATTIQASPRRRGAVLLGALVLVLAFGLVGLGAGVHGLVLGKDGRYSNSKVQMAIWFAVLIVTYVAVVALRAWEGGLAFLGGVNLPQNLLLLSGMSALTFAAAKGITMRNIEKARSSARAEARTQNLVVEDAMREAEHKTKPAAGEAGTSGQGLIANLVSDDQGDPDIGDFQMIVVTLLAVAVYIAQIYAFLGSMEKLRIVTIPDVDTTVLAAFGLGQAAYLTKKYAGKNGA